MNQNKLKITVVIPTFYPAVIYGGVIFSSLYTCRHLAQLGHDVQVATTNVNRATRLDVPTDHWVHTDGFRVRYFKESITDRFSWSMFRELAPILKGSDVVHVQPIFNFSTLLTLWICKNNNIPVFISPRGALGDWIMNNGLKFKKIWMQYLIKPLSKKAYWFATSEQEKNEIVSHFPYAQIFIIPNGIDLSEYQNFTDLDKKSFIQHYTGSLHEYEYIIVSLGRLHKKKGYDVLIQSIALLHKDGINVSLLIAGDDEGEKKNLQALVQQLGLQEYVFIINPLENQAKRNFLYNADLFALTSHNENFGNVYAESLASGTPVIASIYTPWLDLEEKGCGKTVDLDPDHIANAIKNQLNTQNRSEIRKVCQQYIEKFNWPSVANEYIRVYNTIIKK